MNLASNHVASDAPRPLTTGGGGPRRRMTETQLANLRPFLAGDPRTRELAARGGRATRKTKVTEILRQEAEARAEELIRPYLEALAERPRDDWSPATRLEFHLNQTIAAEKLLNRIEGTPVARTKLDTAANEDHDLDGLSTTMLVQLVAAIVTRRR